MCLVINADAKLPTHLPLIPTFGHLTMLLLLELLLLSVGPTLSLRFHLLTLLS